MTTEKFIEEFETLAKKMVATVRAKNNDYAGKRDPFKNFRRHGEYGIVVRMDDKIARLDSFFNPKEGVDQMVGNETIEDTALDLANYALLLVLTHREVAGLYKEPKELKGVHNHETND
jgi:hypothetical protein